ncbi:MAG: HAD-IIA family hydrolase [Actinomycetota bacterium]|nr:HAD-IIA family hydrolase [Actinomycetota bacterium]
MTAASGAPLWAPGRLYDGYLLDLDGTVYLGDELLPGAARLVDGLRSLDRRVVFLSNNPTRDPDAYAERLTGMGIPTRPNDVLTSTVALVRWLRDHHPEATVFPIGEEPLERALREAGIAMTREPGDIDFVVASFDRTLTYAKLQIAFDAIWYHRRARLIATNPDPYCPVAGGRGEPDAAAVIAAIEACTGARCEMTLGKPSAHMAAVALDMLGLDAADCLVVGDRLSTDARMGLDAGMASAVVLTGETTAETVTEAPGDERPTYVVSRIDELMPAGTRRELGWSDE